jgi:putative FmdB family regulatory protein
MAFRLAHFLLHEHDLSDRWQAGGGEMPIYEYRCKDCEHHFTIIESLKDHEGAEPNCPECKSSSVERVIGSVHVQTGKKS